MNGPDKNTFSVDKLLTYGPEMTYGESYWLAPKEETREGKKKRSPEFVLDLGRKKLVNTVELVNTPHNNPENRSMGKFKVFLSDSSDGPWGEDQEVVSGSLENSREQTDPRPVKRFFFKERKARFVKFQQKSFYGDGGGLRYFAVIDSGKTRLHCPLLSVIIIELN